MINKSASETVPWPITAMHFIRNFGACLCLIVAVAAVIFLAMAVTTDVDQERQLLCRSWFVWGLYGVIICNFSVLIFFHGWRAEYSRNNAMVALARRVAGGCRFRSPWGMICSSLSMGFFMLVLSSLVKLSIVLASHMDRMSAVVTLVLMLMPIISWSAELLHGSCLLIGYAIGAIDEIVPSSSLQVSNS